MREEGEESEKERKKREREEREKEETVTGYEMMIKKRQRKCVSTVAGCAVCCAVLCDK